MEEKEGRLYWLFRNSLSGLRAIVWRHKLLSLLVLSGSLLAAFWLRAVIHPYVIVVRSHSFMFTAFIPLMFLWWWTVRNRTWKKVFSATLLTIVGGVTIWFYGGGVHEYLSLYVRYNNLSIVELDELPLTDHERIQPHTSIHTLARGRMGETEMPMQPAFVRIDDGYRFTIGVEPAYAVRRATEGVHEIFNISGTVASPDITRNSRVNVNFNIGETLLWGRNSYTAVVRSFGLWRYFNYEPDNVRYIKDDTGEWVQIISLIRWKGIFFPRPEFGGVQVIRQKSDVDITEPLKRFFRGAGTWVSPNNIPNYKYLIGQNTLSYKASRMMAESFRFQEGFSGPLPWRHVGDVRIADLPEDQNPLPHTMDFNLDHPMGGSKLYQYFALEPFSSDKHGLNSSLFIPADGSPTVFVYKHEEQTGSPLGISQVAALVIDSRKNYDWNRSYPVESKPYIRDIGGKRRFFWLSTVVSNVRGVSNQDQSTGESTEDKSEETGFITGKPEVVIVDPDYQRAVWVDSARPEDWLDTIQTEMSDVWEENK